MKSNENNVRNLKMQLKAVRVEVLKACDGQFSGQFTTMQQHKRDLRGKRTNTNSFEG